MNADHRRPRRRPGRPRRSAWTPAAGGLLLLVIAGCANPELASYYGRHRIPGISASVNGTDVLAGMFSEAGHDVYFRRTLVTDAMQSADTIVWFPDDYAAPGPEVCDWFDAWLAGAPGRTLVYVGRDFDAAPLYWERMRDRIVPDQRRAYELRELDARLRSARPSNLSVDDLACRWFAYEQAKARGARELAGPWAAGIEAPRADIHLNTKMIPFRSRRLLTSQGDWLVARHDVGRRQESRMLLVANGSFLLNLPLVNHENRKLAGMLIAAAGGPGHVVFLESGPGGPPIDPEAIDNSLWTLFGAWPLNAILLQLAIVGVIFCFARWPIFGRPRQPAAESTSDFARHVAAVGRLLARTKDRAALAQRVSEVEPSRSGIREPTAHDGGRPRRGEASLPPESKGNRT